MVNTAQMNMPHVKIENLGQTGRGARVFIDGKEFKSMRHVDVSLGIDDANIVKLEFYATVEVDADPNLYRSIDDGGTRSTPTDSDS